jgi:hypothetical protein
MKHQLSKYFLWLSIIMVLSSCDSFVEVDLPKSQLTNVAVFNDNLTANAALADIYAKLRDGGLLGGSTGISVQLGAFTDEITVSSGSLLSSLIFYNNTLLPSTPSITDYWNSGYNQIYAANSLIEGVDASGALSSENKKLLIGQALFIRGLLHFYLTNLFGDIPYIKDTDYKKNSVVSRIPNEVVYQNIITDLKDAYLLLPESYTSAERITPNKAVCAALLARVYLYNKDYIQAEAQASLLLGQTTQFTLNEPAKVFLNTSKETIWQFHSGVAGQNTKEAQTFIFLTGPPLNFSLTPSLVNAFSSNDYRKENWIKMVSNGTNTWYHAYKYKEQNNTTPSKEYTIVLRLAEQYLIRAEARAQQDNLTSAKEDLNKIRERAGLGNTPAATKTEILEAILKERQLEYFTEYGHRFFDLKRFDKLDANLAGIKPGWNTTDRLFPIPEKELLVNPNLRPQNLGY